VIGRRNILQENKLRIILFINMKKYTKNIPNLLQQQQLLKEFQLKEKKNFLVPMTQNNQFFM
jgi:hypothetical protein